MYYINDKEYKCTVSVTLDIFNDRWKLAIIWHLLDSEKRFKDLHQIISEITQKTLTSSSRRDSIFTQGPKK